MIYMRGQSRDYDQWAVLAGDDTWRWEHCLPFFKQHEDHWRGADAWHGAGKEWRIDKQRLRWDVLDAFAAAARESGIPATDDFNRGNNEGVGYFEVNQKKGWRWNTSKAFLRPVVARPNLQVWTGALTRKVLLAEGRVVGIEVLPAGGGEPIRAHATREVILCAGAVGTPQLLQLSGIGPGALLHQHGVAVQHDLPGVGENLQDHLQIRAVFAVQGVKTLNTIANSLLGKAAIGLEYLLRRSGPMSMAPSQLGAFTRSSPSHEWPNVEYHVQPLSLDAFGQPLHRFNAFTASVCNLNPSSRGFVQIKSPRAEDAPRIQARYLSTPEDRQVAADSLRLTRRIAAMPALARYAPVEVKPGVQFQSDEDLARLAGDIGTTIFHPVGTCRMGRTGEAGAVVDPQLRVQGLVGLRIADASIMPTITSGNTNSPVLMIAERAAQWVRQAHTD
jgi:choline dehydrogenase